MANDIDGRGLAVRRKPATYSVLIEVLPFMRMQKDHRLATSLTSVARDRGRVGLIIATQHISFEET
jgi:hypothetical protein